MIKELELEFIGTGDVRGFNFIQMQSSPNGYLYSVDPGEGNIHFEVFTRKTTPLCIDFEKHIYSEVDSKVCYPSTNSFGVNAWCITNYNEAVTKFNSL
jgi:hypothetical protein